MIGRRRLGREHVEDGAREPAVLEGGEQVGLDHVAAATGIHQGGTGGQAGEQVAIQDPAGRTRERQQADQDVGAGQEVAQGRVACEGLDPSMDFDDALQPRIGKPKLRKACAAAWRERRDP